MTSSVKVSTGNKYHTQSLQPSDISGIIGYYRTSKGSVYPDILFNNLAGPEKDLLTC